MNYYEVKILAEKLFGPLEVPEVGTPMIDEDETKLVDPDDNNDGFPEDPVKNQKGEEVIPLFVSELLTPNQPGVESTWRIVNIEKYPTANVKVYSVDWNIVFESWSYKNDWDGKGKDGNSLPSGPYYYIIDRGDETTVIKGWLYIFN